MFDVAECTAFTPRRSSHPKGNNGVKEVLSRGINAYLPYGGSRHAEWNAIERLPWRQAQRAKRAVDLVVIKTSPTGNYGNSQPCRECIRCLARRLPQKGYKLCWIYYTSVDEGLVRCRLEELQDSKTPHISSFYNRKIRRAC